MVVAETKKKKPPTFPYLPKSSAKRLKKSWVEDHKIRSKWKAQKRREGLTTQNEAKIEGAPNHDDANADYESDTAPNYPEKSPMPTASHEKQSLRELRKLAYISKPQTQRVDASQSKRTHEHSRSSHGGRAKTGQPDMSLRMNVLLEKIKRDIS